MATEEYPLLDEETMARARERNLKYREESIARSLTKSNPRATPGQIQDTAEQLTPPMYELWIMGAGYEISGRFGRHGLKFEEKIEPAEPREFGDSWEALL